jgi:tetratricopeptide (TPR) repeat protein
MTEAFGAVLGLRQQKKFEQAYEALDDLLHRLSLPKRQVLKGLAVPDVIDLLTQRGVVETDKLIGVAKVLREEAGISRDAGEFDASSASLLKAIRLYAEAVRICRIQRSALPEAEPLAAMLAETKRTELRSDACIALAHAFEAYGRYDEAENRWFDAMERVAEEQGDAADEYEQGVKFYERLLRLDEALLERGALPADEVREGLADFTRRYGPTRAFE